MPIPAPLPRRNVTCLINNAPIQLVDLSMEQEQIDVSAMSNVKPNPKWEHVDSAGHFHAYAADGKTPTLHEVSEEYWCEDCHEHHTSYSTQCVLCGEEIRPGTVNYGAYSRSIPGPQTWTLRVTGQVEQSNQVSVRVDDNGRTLFGFMYVGPSRVELGRPAVTELVGGLVARMAPEPKS